MHDLLKIVMEAYERREDESVPSLLQLSLREASKNFDWQPHFLKLQVCILRHENIYHVPSKLRGALSSNFQASLQAFE